MFGNKDDGLIVVSAKGADDVDMKQIVEMLNKAYGGVGVKKPKRPIILSKLDWSVVSEDNLKEIRKELNALAEVRNWDSGNN